MTSTLSRVAQQIAAQSRYPANVTAFLRQRYEGGGPNAIAEEQHLRNVETFLISRLRYQELFHTYYKGELTAEEAAHRMGLRMPYEEADGAATAPTEGAHAANDNQPKQ